jgi:putative aminopeptidase FrvX
MILEELSNLFGVSSYEEDVRNYLKEKLTPKVSSVKVDSLGNLILFKQGRNCSKKVMFLAHMDEVGLMVRQIQKNGMIKFAVLGSIDDSILPAKRVVLLGKEKLAGVISTRPIHVQRGPEYDTPITKDRLYIDVGANSSDELKGKIELGDPIGFDTTFEKLGTSTFKGKAFDDRVGCAVLAEIILKDITPEYDTWFVFAVQEEVGCRGSKAATFRIQPDLAFVIEGTTACDVPMVERSRYTTQMGKGPSIVVAHNGLVFQKKVLQFMESTAKINAIPYQIKEKIAGGTDATNISRTAEGVYTGLLSLPVRYIHSPVSLLNEEDYLNAIRLTETMLKETKTFFEEYA